jgi:phthalate 4,5-dioxygenase
MLSHEDNETLVRVGPNTPMGSLFRLYWIPFYLSKDLIADDQPKRVMLLGEDLVVFRDSDQRVGLVANACAHRGAPLMFGRNEDCGLRCVYHGWKFDVTGAVTDMPAEPAKSRFKEKVRITAYPCVERNGVLWTYMGPRDTALPPLPNLEWNLVPVENVHVSMRIQECNWLQALEGEIDSAHAPILHSRIDSKGAINKWLATRDLRPTFECVRQDFGMSIAAKRKLDEATNYWRVNQFMLPFYSLVPPQSKFPELSGHAWVPMNDEHTLCIMFSYHPSEPLLPRMRELFEQGHNGRETGHPTRDAFVKRDPTTPYPDYWTKFTRENGFRFDYQAQVDTWFSGLPGLWVQDAACQEAVAPIMDRSKENLGVSDVGIIRMRRRLLKAARELRDSGIRPATAESPEVYGVRAASPTLDRDVDWREASAGFCKAGGDYGYEVL